jgi:hypothetical protein
VKFENGVGEGLHQGDWMSEIDAITTDCVTHAGTLEDPYVGLLWTVQKMGITSGTSIAFNPSSLQNYAPEKLNKLLYALNNLDVVDDALVYTLRNLLTTTVEATQSDALSDGAGTYTIASPGKDHTYSLYTDYGTNNQTLIATYTATDSTAYTFTGLTANTRATLSRMRRARASSWTVSAKIASTGSAIRAIPILTPTISWARFRSRLPRIASRPKWWRSSEAILSISLPTAS